MEIKAIAGEIGGIEAGALIVNYFEGAERPGGDVTTVDEALGGAISRLVSQGEIKGKPGEITVIHSLGKLPADRIVVAGMGKPAELTLTRIRRVAAETCRLLRKKEVADIAIVAPESGIDSIGPEGSAQAITEGALLGLYTFRRHKTGDAEHGEIKRLLIIADDKAGLPIMEQGIGRGKLLADATNLARDMANEPANYMTPTHMADAAAGIAGKYGLEINILEREQMQELGMGALIGVAQGSKQPPKFIVLTYHGLDSPEIEMALIGKAITFDSGGISIKPSAKMEEMKGDMSGGAAVLAAMSAISQLKPAVNIMAIVPATENLPGSNALKPGDVLKAMGGKTIEIISTDAEGRLILADALGYARTKKVNSIVDVATLTGACQVALGDIYTGVFGNNQALVDRVMAAGKESGELLWQMPMHEYFSEQNKSDIADIKNTGGRYGGAITAAQFLAEFAGDTPWVHMDIAGTMTLDKYRDDLVKGATGVAVRTLVNLALSAAKQ